MAARILHWKAEGAVRKHDNKARLAELEYCLEGDVKPGLGHHRRLMIRIMWPRHFRVCRALS